jgi:putative ABC transport system ATP-binding protein
VNTVEVMNLLLNINITRKTTCVMVTHNPDIECYADRLLYLEDGKFIRQVLNLKQCSLDLERYQGAFLGSCFYFFFFFFLRIIDSIASS